MHATETDAALTPAQTAVARQRAYALFSRLFRDGITTATRPFLESIPELADGLKRPFQPDEAAAAHHDLFQFNVLPYESLFLAADGLLGGSVSHAVSHSYQQVGWQVDAAASSPDHIGHELGLLAFLSAAEADAWADDLLPEAVRMRQRQSDFLQGHLLRWLPPFVLAIRRQAHPFYAKLAALTLALAADHVTAFVATDAFTLPPPPDLLADEKTGLKEIAAFLMTPLHSGLFLSRDDVARLGRAHQLPRGFGGRAQLLTNLLRTAVQYDAFPTLVSALQALLAAEETAYEAMLHDHPPLAPFVTPWLARCRDTHRLLAQLQVQSNTA